MLRVLHAGPLSRTQLSTLCRGDMWVHGLVCVTCVCVHACVCVFGLWVGGPLKRSFPGSREPGLLQRTLGDKESSTRGGGTGPPLSLRILLGNHLLEAPCGFSVLCVCLAGRT